MRAYLILHLPMLSSSKRFRALLNEISRYGVTVKGAFGEGQEEEGQHSGIEDVTAEDIADDQFRLTEQGSGGDTGEEFRQRGDGSQDHTADEGAGDAGAFVDDVHIIGELDGEAHHNYSEDQISDNDHRLYLPVISNGRKSISFRSRRL